MTGAVRILVVDDEPDIEALVTQRFRREIRKGEMSFVFARDGEEALKVLDSDPEVLMVLSDINMPRMDGLTLLSRIGEAHRDLRTVVVSAYGDMTNIRTAMNRGAFDFLTKPIEFSDLDTTIRKTLSHLEEYREMQRRQAEAELSRAILARYFSPNIVASLSSQSGGFKPRGEWREATFLFTDLAGFTHLVETTSPDVIGDLLNAYIDGIARIVFAHDGTMMKVIGDAIHAAFGAPVAQPDHAERAVACALDIDEFAEAYREHWRARGIDLGATRIGVNSGKAMIGDFGGDAFFDYTAYGDAVNIASRLEAANKVLGTRLCVSQNTVDRIAGFTGRPIGLLQLPGMSEPVPAYEPLDPSRADSPEVAAYTSAYGLLAGGDTSARQAFAALVGAAPDDPLTLFHLQRTLAGATGILIDAG
ncbi:adenylate/guanylate cyclase domain-containing protein [Futiania mangrovi]|uniref:Response regulator n=1 Tax=Futiania mangrovi TaxID=2959716 RepID=A0A9J6PGB3_9PROT|nr:adenylate/guanylate cyclase domain-containing protein [Futiania mangrovii]MCP1337777.1 response regulator [Futiania mangrovii]